MTTKSRLPTGCRFFPNFTGNASNFWSASPNANNSSNAWNVNFNNGNSNNNNRNNNKHVRLVRSGE
ncbi:MAG: DUF1566 domain-containing protein [Desulfobacterales bacterium]|nr:DUF1566 domain-containing protein [Desulfobacterales bacterium]